MENDKDKSINVRQSSINAGNVAGRDTIHKQVNMYFGKEAHNSDIGKAWLGTFANPVKAISHYLTNNICYYTEKISKKRVENLAHITRIANESGGEQISLHPKLVEKIIVAGSLEDDDYLQNVWARLIRKSDRSNGINLTLSFSFAHLIEKLEPEIAVLYDKIYQTFLDYRKGYFYRWKDCESFNQEDDVNSDFIEINIDNLKTLNHIKNNEYYVHIESLIHLNLISRDNCANGFIRITELGHQFAKVIFEI